MKIAVIDLGTNTFNLLIVEVNSDKSYSTVFQTKISVKLAEGGMNKGFIADIAFDRGIEAFKTHFATTQKFHVDKIYAFATSAIRGASNGVAFVQKVKGETGVDIQVISGDREAELIYYGVRSAVEMTDEASLIIDIGGGSTELIFADQNGIIALNSFNMGISRIYQLFDLSDPLSIDDIQKILDDADNSILNQNIRIN